MRRAIKSIHVRFKSQTMTIDGAQIIHCTGRELLDKWGKLAKDGRIVIHSMDVKKNGVYRLTVTWNDSLEKRVEKTTEK